MKIHSRHEQADYPTKQTQSIALREKMFQKSRPVVGSDIEMRVLLAKRAKQLSLNQSSTGQ